MYTPSAASPAALGVQQQGEGEQELEEEEEEEDSEGAEPLDLPPMPQLSTGPSRAGSAAARREQLMQVDIDHIYRYITNAVQPHGVSCSCRLIFIIPYHHGLSNPFKINDY